MNAKLRAAVATELQHGRYEQTPDGLLMPRIGAMAAGDYFCRKTGAKHWEELGKNLVVPEGLAFMLNVALGPTAKAGGFYLAIFSGSASPTGTWTAASFAAAASEITSTAEGHTSATRPAWMPAETSTPSIDNMASATQLTFATSSELTVTGMALLTNNVRGGTSGKLISASLFPTARKFQNGDKYDMGYRVSLTT